ncbi:hypothetical protein D3C76_344670 [compost metagenome]
MPAEGAERAGETTADRAGGVDADQVQVACFTLEQGQYFVQCGQGVFLQAMAVPGIFVQAQVRVECQQRQGLAQLLERNVQALAIQLQVATQGYLLLRLAPIAHQPQLRAGLADFAGLAHLGMVETHELRLLGTVTEGELLARLKGGAHLPDQGFESLFHHASPPNTSIWRNTQAGEAWPTRTT